MENRKSLKFLIPILISGFFVFNIQNALAYGVETHAFLTKTVVEFYNQHFPNKKIPDELTAYIIDGSRLEDNTPRFLHHFYDPVNNRGLQDKIYRGLASKEWAQNEKAQTALLNRIIPQTKASILTAIQIEKIKPTFHRDNFTWQRAIELYAEGETEAALFALGHIVHLIEDASVPDHTRNDSHPPYDDGGSPYENWTNKFNLDNPDSDLVNNRLRDKKPIGLDNLDTHFDEMAAYSNKNFYSRDSIKNYELPVPDYLATVGDYLYGFKKDDDGIEYYLAVYLIPKNFDYIRNNKDAKIILEERDGNLRIFRDYWHRLSTKAVQYSAGVVNLFFQEAEKAKSQLALERSRKPYLATLVTGIKSIFGGGEVQDIGDFVDGFKKVAEVKIAENESPLPKDRVLIASLPEVKPESSPHPLPETTEDKAKIETELVSLQLQSVEPIKICNFQTTQSPIRQNVIINEVAWMGSAASANDEWIELQNRSGSEVDLSGWQILDLGEQIKVKLSGKLSAGGFYLLERTDDNSVPGVNADQTYTGALSNVGEGLHLFDKSCVLVDEVFAAPDWPAGENDYKRTMERAADFSWRNYSGESQNGIFGTPKAENSPGTMPISTAGGGSPRQPSTPTPVSSTEPAPAVLPPSSNPNPETPVVKVLISEILFDASGSDTGKEFIELYNPTDQIVDLSSWSIQHLAVTGSLSKKNFEAGNVIAPKSFFLIWLGSDPRANLTWSSGSLNNSSATLYLTNSHDPISTSSPANFVDSASYDVSQLSGFTEGQSFERKSFQNNICVSSQNNNEYLGNGCDTDSAQNDFELRPTPNPQNAASLPEPRSTPAAVVNFNAAFNSSSMELNLSWATSSGLTYTLAAVNSPAQPILIDTTAAASTQKILEIGRDYKFEITAKDNDGLASSPVQITASVPSFLNSISFHQDPLATTSPKYLLDLSWASYPFIPINLPPTTCPWCDPVVGWHAVVFNYNQEPNTTQTLFWNGNPPEGPWGLNMPGGLQVEYPNCFGEPYKTKGASLILPAKIEKCDALQGYFASYAFDWLKLGAGGITLNVVPENFASAAPVAGQNYVTAAFYAYRPGYESNNYGLELVAIDKNKYYFKSE